MTSKLQKIFKRQILSCYDELKGYSQTEAQLFERTKRFRDRLRHKRAKDAFMTWIKALALSKALTTVGEIQQKSLYRQGFAMLSGNMEEHNLEREQILKILRTFSQKRPENLMQF